MLEYAKMILQKVSFDENLFKKELLKSLGWLNEQERMELQQWTMRQFNHLFGNSLPELFKLPVRNKK